MCIPRARGARSRGCSAAASWTCRCIPAIRLRRGGRPSPAAASSIAREAKTLLKIPVLPISYDDALPLLQNLQGAVAPESWRGALPVTYHVGPGPAKVHLKLAFDWQVRPLYNVIVAHRRARSIPMSGSSTATITTPGSTARPIRPAATSR